MVWSIDSRLKRAMIHIQSILTCMILYMHICTPTTIKQSTYVCTYVVYVHTVYTFATQLISHMYSTPAINDLHTYVIYVRTFATHFIL